MVIAAKRIEADILLWFDQKQCHRCLAVKPLSDFYLNKNSRDGHGPFCSACALADAMRYEVRVRATIRRDLALWARKVERDALLMSDQQRCPCCDRVLPLMSFYKLNESRIGYGPKCKSCVVLYLKSSVTPEQKRAWRKKVRSKPGYALDEKLRDRHGINLVFYEKMLTDQVGVCAICSRHETHEVNGKRQRLSVDHDHETGVVRGLLCNLCNTGLGCARESISTLKAMIEYLERHGAKEET